MVGLCNALRAGVAGKLVRQFVREYPPLRPLTIILKIFLVSTYTFDQKHVCVCYMRICVYNEICTFVHLTDSSTD